MQTMLCLVSGQNLPNYRGVKEIQPDKVVFLYTPQTKNQLHVLTQTLTIPAECFETNYYDYDELKERCCRLLNSTINSDWILNMTGGTKLAALACYQVFREKKLPAFYVDSVNRRLLFFDKTKVRTVPFRSEFSIEEIIQINGQTVNNYFEDESSLVQRQAHANHLFEIHRYKRGGIARRFEEFINQIPADALKGKPIGCTVRNARGRYEITDHKVYYQYRDGNYNFPGAEIPGDSAATFPITGQWFEEYVYLLLKKSGFFRQHALRLTLDWQIAPARGPKNEIDIALVRNDYLYLIECKSGMVRADDINKLKNYKELFGGHFAIPVLISYFPIRKNMLEKLEENQIDYFAGWRKMKDLPGFLAGLSPKQQ